MKFIKRNRFFYFLIIIFFSVNISEYKIILKLDNEIITNIDVYNEIKFLKIFNPNINKLSENEIFELSKNSLIKQKIKIRETKKFFSVSETSNLGNELVKEYYSNQGYKQKSEFISFLEQKNLNIDVFKEKLVVEKLWNTLIFEKFKNKVRINEKNIKKNLINFNEKRIKNYQFNLSELLFTNDIDVDEIKNFIGNYGFENAANKYSISDTATKGGKIGWIDINNLTKEIKKEILILNVGEITQPIDLKTGKIIIKLNSKREIKNKFNIEEELKKRINFERNKQLNSFSLNYFKKLKQNSSINEY